eukprot:CAMPEP_0176136340 /NCGR_PEP_ID=MMETSP0120_2-20121206/69187_1 /TAXON_ID=160619 /ORGANISM="Kryptoperidinium foliaceum, Strain CCMP 1326" /LENGTH=81 /DNA_ID=CAMNT_0017472107 /DNA_START=79 /DNA_END=319 /DNA_ORIENTATION=-
MAPPISEPLNAEMAISASSGGLVDHAALAFPEDFRLHRLGQLPEMRIQVLVRCLHWQVADPDLVAGVIRVRAAHCDNAAPG